MHFCLCITAIGYFEAIVWNCLRTLCIILHSDIALISNMGEVQSKKMHNEQ